MPKQNKESHFKIKKLFVDFFNYKKHVMSQLFVYTRNSQ
jgi:hypothetical protein